MRLGFVRAANAGVSQVMRQLLKATWTRNITCHGNQYSVVTEEDGEACASSILSRGSALRQLLLPP